MRYSGIIATATFIGAALGSVSHSRQAGTSRIRRHDVELIEYDPEMCEGKQDEIEKFKQHKCQFIFDFDLNETIHYQVNVASLEDYANDGDEADFMLITTGNHEYSFNAWTNQVKQGFWSEPFTYCSINQGRGNLANEVMFVYTFTGEDGESESGCELQLTGSPMSSGKWNHGDTNTCVLYSDCTVFEN